MFLEKEFLYEFAIGPSVSQGQHSLPSLPSPPLVSNTHTDGFICYETDESTALLDFRLMIDAVAAS